MTKRNFFISSMAVFLVLANVETADATIKCVALNPNDTCSYSGTSVVSRPDFQATCGTTAVQIVDACSITTADANEAVDVIYYESKTHTGDYYYCFCKMISPAVSKWVRAGSIQYSTISDCNGACGALCAAKNGLGNSAFRTAMFNNLID